MIMRDIVHGGGGAKVLASLAVVFISIFVIGTPMSVLADTVETARPTYQLYDTHERNEQVAVRKVWDDGLDAPDRQYVDGKQIQDYSDLITMTIQTSVPQTTLRSYTIIYDANGGSYGTDTNGNAIATNTITTCRGCIAKCRGTLP